MSKSLVAYFSASGVTAKVAMKLAQALGTDVYEIRPKVPYTKADLNWMNKSSRSSIEMNNKGFRPEIITGDVDVSKYDTIYLGFPIKQLTSCCFVAACQPIFERYAIEKSL